MLLDLLNHAYFDLKTVALLIFDECHHALGRRHPFRLILDYYRRILPGFGGYTIDDKASFLEDRARVLGLTASVLNKNVSFSLLDETVNKLEKIMCSRLEAVNDLTSVIFSAKVIYFTESG